MEGCERQASAEKSFDLVKGSHSGTSLVHSNAIRKRWKRVKRTSGFTESPLDNAFKGMITFTIPLLSWSPNIYCLCDISKGLENTYAFAQLNVVEGLLPFQPFSVA